MTFRPMGGRLADTLVRNLNGEFADELELNEEFAALLETDSTTVEGTLVHETTAE